MFQKLKQAIQKNFENIMKGQSKLFYKDIDRDKIWDLYLEGFSPEERQGHNCNCCKSFLRRYSGIVVIDAQLEVKSIWDINLNDIDEEYRQSVKNIHNYLKGLPITNVFLNPFPKLGTDKNFDPIKNTTWNHFFLQLPNQFIHR